MPQAFLPDRGVIEIRGEDATSWLQGLVTCDVVSLLDKEARLGALLSPQGKILFDFLIVHQDLPKETRYFLDTDRARAADLAKRLAFYRLRAKVSITDFSAPSAPLPFFIVAEWGGDYDEGWDGYADPRHPALGRRVILEGEEAFHAGDPNAYHARRIALGVPEGGRDFAFGDAFPHEALMDRLGGVDFKKGCYVGQEVVSRMQHRGTARTRLVRIAFSGKGPHSGAAVRSGEKQIGTVGSVGEGIALAMIRLDRLAEAEQRPIEADGCAIAVLDKD